MEEARGVEAERLACGAARVDWGEEDGTNAA